MGIFCNSPKTNSTYYTVSHRSVIESNGLSSDQTIKFFALRLQRSALFSYVASPMRYAEMANVTYFSPITSNTVLIQFLTHTKQVRVASIVLKCIRNSLSSRKATASPRERLYSNNNSARPGGQSRGHTHPFVRSHYLAGLFEHLQPGFICL